MKIAIFGVAAEDVLALGISTAMGPSGCPVITTWVLSLQAMYASRSQLEIEMMTGQRASRRSRGNSGLSREALVRKPLAGPANVVKTLQQRRLLQSVIQA